MFNMMFLLRLTRRPGSPDSSLDDRQALWRGEIIEASGVVATTSTRNARLSDARFPFVRRAGLRRATMAAPKDSRATVQRPLLLAGGVCAALIALYSCSMEASITTDRDGRIVELSSVRIESSLSRWAIEMLVIGGQIAVELRWIDRSKGETRTRTDCTDDEDISGPRIVSVA
ncbi:MAG TPA: hypothetical protein VH041_13510 [Caldimonas sp.]|nr:hypothetical protein [Caldimonas sp.]HEX4235307.1 hypothetical protein [Caldimonas sp.]